MGRATIVREGPDGDGEEPLRARRGGPLRGGPRDDPPPSRARAPDRSSHRHRRSRRRWQSPPDDPLHGRSASPGQPRGSPDLSGRAVAWRRGVSRARPRRHQARLRRARARIDRDRADEADEGGARSARHPQPAQDISRTARRRRVSKRDAGLDTRSQSPRTQSRAGAVTDRLSILTPDGTLVDGAKPSMTDTALIEALRWMLMSRIYDERATGLQRQGLYGVFSPALGQEASVVGSTMALDPARDWIVPQYRELVALVRHGYPLERLAAMGMGRVTEAARIPDAVNVLPNQVALATQLPHATGLAWGLKLQKKDSVVMTYVGDGGSSEVDFHEGLNLSGVPRSPVVLFLSDNP